MECENADEEMICVWFCAFQKESDFVPESVTLCRVITYAFEGMIINMLEDTGLEMEGPKDFKIREPKNQF